MSKLPFDPGMVESADTEILSDGWDNFLLSEELSELEEYLVALSYLSAPRCAAVVKEILKLVADTKPARAIDLTDSHKAQLDLLWNRYREASRDEDPRNLVEKLIDQGESPAPKVGGPHRVVAIDLGLRVNASCTDDVWHSCKTELKELNPSTKGRALKTKNATLKYLSAEFGGPIEIRFMNAEKLLASGEVGKKAVRELKRFFKGFFKVPPEYIKVRWED